MKTRTMLLAAAAAVLTVLPAGAAPQEDPIIGWWTAKYVVSSDKEVIPLEILDRDVYAHFDEKDYILYIEEDLSVEGSWSDISYMSDEYDHVYLLDNDDNLQIVGMAEVDSLGKPVKLDIMIGDIMFSYVPEENGASKYGGTSSSGFSVKTGTSGSSSGSAYATTGQKNALEKAKSYLSFTNFSHDGLIDQLEYSGFTHEEALYAADYCGADWKEQAALKAKSYLSVSAFSYQGLIDQLEYSKFTTEEATYGADRCGADWKEQAALKAKSYLEVSSFSKERLISQLEYSGFTHEQAVYGAAMNGY